MKKWFLLSLLGFAFIGLESEAAIADLEKSPTTESSQVSESTREVARYRRRHRRHRRGRRHGRRHRHHYRW